MPFNRREFSHLGAGSVAASLFVSPPLTQALVKTQIKAIACDALTTFDTRPIVMLADQLFPNKGADLSNAWRTRQFEYTWLRSVSHREVVAILARFIDDDHRHLPIGRTGHCQPGIADSGLPRALAPGPVWLMHEVVSLHLPAIRQEENIGVFAFHEQRALMLRGDLLHPLTRRAKALGDTLVKAPEGAAV